MGVKFILGLVGIISLLGAGAAAQAAEACFEWDCTHEGEVCTFDASCTSPSTGIWKYSWNFGDGTGEFTGYPATSHTYPGNGYFYPTVKLKVIYLYGSAEADVECLIYRRIPAGPTHPLSGTCSAS